MKKIAKLMIVCMAGFAIFSLVSCGSKVDKAELDKKVQKSMVSDDELEFSDDEYQFMADYLCDSFDNFEKNGEDINKKDQETNGSYLLILMMADAQGKLNKETKEKLELLQKNIYSSNDYKSFKENEEALLDSLQTADIDWEEVFEVDDDEDEDGVSEYEVVEEY